MDVLVASLQTVDVFHGVLVDLILVSLGVLTALPLMVLHLEEYLHFVQVHLIVLVSSGVLTALPLMVLHLEEYLHSARVRLIVLIIQDLILALADFMQIVLMELLICVVVALIVQDSLDCLLVLPISITEM